MSTRHVYPVGDLIDHATDGSDCICGPTVEPVELEGDLVGYVMVHHSLDGRELRESDRTRT